MKPRSLKGRVIRLLRFPPSVASNRARIMKSAAPATNIIYVISASLNAEALSTNTL